VDQEWVDLPFLLAGVQGAELSSTKVEELRAVEVGEIVSINYHFLQVVRPVVEDERVRLTDATKSEE